MKLIEAESFLNGYPHYNLKVEMKNKTYEYTTKSLNPELQTINSRKKCIEIPIFI